MPRAQPPLPVSHSPKETPRKHAAAQSTSPQLYLVLSVTVPGPDLCALVTKAQSCGPIGCVLLEGEAGASSAEKTLGSTIAFIQKLGIATLLSTDVALAQRLHADGVHLSANDADAEDILTLRRRCGEGFILGADAGGSRHQAMCLGESGADYIAFGKKTNPTKTEDAFEAQRDLLSWWSQLFEVPSVAMDIATPTEAQALLSAGADFLAIKVPQERTSTTVADFLSPYFALLHS